MKKSLEEAMRRAEEHSKRASDVFVWVMDKEGERSVAHVADWCKEERLKEGYRVVARFRKGKRLG